MCLNAHSYIYIDSLMDSNADNNQNLHNLLKYICAQKQTHVLILGDFNFKEINWDNFSCNINETRPAYEFQECVRDQSLYLPKDPNYQKDHELPERPFKNIW